MSGDDRALVGAAKRRTPVEGVPQRQWHEETTGVHTDPQVFHALKSLHGEMQANKREAAQAHGALRKDLDAFKTSVSTTLGGFDEKLDRVAESSARTAGAVEVLAQQRSRTPSTDTRTVAAAVVTETLATHVLEERKATRAERIERWKFAGKVAAAGAAIVEVLHRVGVL